MNANDIKWITSGNLEHNPFYFSVPEKLDKFGYCIDFSGYGEGKTDKAQLCILDTINKKEKPNILIICPEGGKESWYTCLLKGVGLDFKFINGAKGSIVHFSPEMSNLMLLDETVLAEGEGSAFEPIKRSGMVWDLIIIDGSGAVDGLDTDLYALKVGMKTERLLIFAPYPSVYVQPPEKIRDIVSSLLRDDAAARSLDMYNIDEKVMDFTMESPLANYPKEDEGENAVTIVRYNFPDADIPASLHIDDQGGARYSHGGNVFEEYDLPERKIYSKAQYTRSDAETLKNKDKKLGKFLDVINGIMNSDDKTAVVYCCSDSTAEYIEKILSSIYYDRAESIVYFEKTSFDIRKLKQWYETVPGRRVRVVLASDKLSENFGIYSPITHIINYELPDNPVVLHQRYKRRGLVAGGKPEFVIFLDDNKMFDSRILGKVLAGNLYKAFRQNMPYENIMFDIEGIDRMLAETLVDIKYVADYTGAVGASFDIILHFKNDYNVPPERNLTTASNVHEYSQKKLETLGTALGVSDLLREKDIDKSALLARISEKIKSIRSGFSWFDKDLNVHTMPHGSAKGSEYRQFAGYLDGNPFNLGLKNARSVLGSAVEGKKEFSYIKGAVTQLPDAMQPAVLYNIWIYWHKTLGIGGSYAQFIKAYNEGVI